MKDKNIMLRIGKIKKLEDKKRPLYECCKMRFFSNEAVNRHAFRHYIYRIHFAYPRPKIQESKLEASPMDEKEDS